MITLFQINVSMRNIKCRFHRIVILAYLIDDFSEGKFIDIVIGNLVLSNNDWVYDTKPIDFIIH